MTCLYMYLFVNLSRPARKPTLWTLHKVLTRIIVSMLHMLTRIDTFCLLCFFVSGIITLYFYATEMECVDLDQSARGHYVGFLAGRLNFNTVYRKIAQLVELYLFCF